MTTSSHSGQPVSYLMENDAEAERLEAKTEREVSERLLRLVGLQPGMRAADAGAGTGAVARVMGDIVGKSGRVVALDQSEARLDFGHKLARESGLENVSFVRANLEEAIPEGPYDLIWSRFVFEYLRDPELVLENLIRATCVGGKVVVGDLDGNAALHYPIAPAVEAGLARVFEATKGHFDPNVGRKLFHLFRKAKLGQVRVHVEPYHLYAGSVSGVALANWEQKLRTIRPMGVRAFPHEAAYDAWADSYLEMLRDPDVFTYSVLILVEGVRER